MAQIRGGGSRRRPRLRLVCASAKSMCASRTLHPGLVKLSAREPKIWALARGACTGRGPGRSSPQAGFFTAGANARERKRLASLQAPM